MFIAMLKTVDSQTTIETDTFGKAIKEIHHLMESTTERICEALILEDCKVVVSMRTVR